MKTSDHGSFDLVTAAKAVSVREDNENVKTLVLALTSGIPVVGGPLAALLGDYLPDSFRLRLQEFIKQLAADVERLKSRVDGEAAKTESYGLMYLHVLRQVAATDVEEKLEAYRAILVNSLLPDALNQIERDYFLSLVEQLRQIHFVVLSLYRDPHRFTTFYQTSWPRNDLSVALVDCLEQFDISDDLFTRAIDDLQRLSVLSVNADNDVRYLTENGRRRRMFFERPADAEDYWRALNTSSLMLSDLRMLHPTDEYSSDDTYIEHLPKKLGEVVDLLAEHRLTELSFIREPEEADVLHAVNVFWDNLLFKPVSCHGELTKFGKRFSDFVALPD